MQADDSHLLQNRLVITKPSFTSLEVQTSSEIESLLVNMLTLFTPLLIGFDFSDSMSEIVDFDSSAK